MYPTKVCREQNQVSYAKGQDHTSGSKVSRGNSLYVFYLLNQRRDIDNILQVCVSDQAPTPKVKVTSWVQMSAGEIPICSISFEPVKGL